VVVVAQVDDKSAASATASSAKGTFNLLLCIPFFFYLCSVVFFFNLRLVTGKGAAHGA